MALPQQIVLHIGQLSTTDEDTKEIEKTALSTGALRMTAQIGRRVARRISDTVENLNGNEPINDAVAWKIHMLACPCTLCSAVHDGVAVFHRTPRAVCWTPRERRVLYRTPLPLLLLYTSSVGGGCSDARFEYVFSLLH